ncbi:MAG: polyphenol oxidase family protein [Ignavibacteria bacterium]|nr:polyphenol oxidase family protein [Ignavibacteria bacterium]
MSALHHAFDDQRIVSGMTTTDTSLNEAYHLICTTLNVNHRSIITLHQVHGDAVHRIDRSWLLLNTQNSDSDFPQLQIQGDALITNLPGIVIGVKVADCAGILLWDAAHNAIGAVHSGWRGTAIDVLGKTIRAMQMSYGTDSQHLRVWLSPHAKAAHYEVGRDVYDVHAPYCIPHKQTPDKWFFDNAMALREQAQAAGVPLGNIAEDPACTMTDTRFHSYRRDGEAAGRGLVVIQMK